jgi:hypothetical protein
MADDKILSQAEIDELLSKKSPKPKPRPPVAKAATAEKPPEPKVVAPPPEPTPPPAPPPQAAAPPPPPEPAPPPEPLPKLAAHVKLPSGTAGASYKNYSSDEVAKLQETVGELARHLVKISSVLQRVDKIEEKVNQILAFIKLDPESTTQYERRLDEIQRTLEKFIKTRPDIRDEFMCDKCQTKKAVAIHVKCTKCGKENWMGWWPEDEHKKPNTELKQQAEQKQQDNTANT